MQKPKAPETNKYEARTETAIKYSRIPPKEDCTCALQSSCCFGGRGDPVTDVGVEDSNHTDDDTSDDKVTCSKWKRIAKIVNNLLIKPK